MTLISMMDPTFLAAILSPALPLSAFAAIMLLFRQCPRVSARLSIAAVTGSLMCALFLLIRHGDALTPVVFSRPWMISDAIQIPIGFMLDPLNLLMLTIVTGISCLVQIYSLGYMAGDPGFARYYAYMSLFAWAMISLVLAPSLFQLYVFWELVGLASYLLIGFWFEKFSASRAGKKAFVMTRLGDAAFLLGLMIILVHVGNLEITTLNGPEPLPGMSPGLITLVALLIFGGIIGKSAQFPLLTWLPDAMEGPTPVSALLHSATMVAAGVYLLARLFPFFSLSTTAMTVCLAVGTISMLMASTMALVSRDIKQVWAYSTISQLGFMLMGLGAGGYVAGVFHLTTHAAFKALLFLCSGVFIHALGTNDMVAIGQAGGRRMRLPIVCMTLGAASLAGLPPFSGFFSKELILSALAGQTNPLWLTAGLAGAFLTAYYAFRLIFMILIQPSGPDSKPAHTGDHHPRDRHSETWMAIPLVILTTLTLVLGFAEHPLDRFLTAAGHGLVDAVDGSTWVPYAGMGLALAGVVLAWMEFGRANVPRIGFVERLPAVANFFRERWYLDHLYQNILERVVDNGLARLCAKNDDQVIDGAIHGLSSATVSVSRMLGILQAGTIQSRLLIIFTVLVLLALYFFV